MPDTVTAAAAAVDNKSALFRACVLGSYSRCRFDRHQFTTRPEE